jgi:hypothetical protein
MILVGVISFGLNNLREFKNKRNIFILDIFVDTLRGF